MAYTHSHTHTHALYVAMKMPLGAKYKEVCVCFVCVRGETTPFYTVTMEFIIILMMLQLRRVSVG